MKCKECGTELLEGDCICSTCGAEVNVFFQNPVSNFVSPSSDESEYRTVYPTYEEAELLRRQRRQETPDISSSGFSRFINSPLFRHLEIFIIVISVALTLYCFNQNCFSIDVRYNGLITDLSSVSNVKVKQLTYNILSGSFNVHFSKLMLALSIITLLALFTKNTRKWASLTIILQLISALYCIRSASKILANAKRMLPSFIKQYNLEKYDMNVKLDIGIGYKLLILITILLSLSLIMQLLRFITKSYKSGSGYRYL